MTADSDTSCALRLSRETQPATFEDTNATAAATHVQPPPLKALAHKDLRRNTPRNEGATRPENRRNSGRNRNGQKVAPESAAGALVATAQGGHNAIPAPGRNWDAGARHAYHLCHRHPAWGELTENGQGLGLEALEIMPYSPWRHTMKLIHDNGEISGAVGFVDLGDLAISMQKVNNASNLELFKGIRWKWFPCGHKCGHPRSTRPRSYLIAEAPSALVLVPSADGRARAA
jgi:hypothetical protein